MGLKIVQVIRMDHKSNQPELVLCDDGNLWALERSVYPSRWEKVIINPPLPEREEK